MTLGILWFMLIALLITVYFVLDGFDLGSAILMPFVAKTEGEKRAVTHAIGPVWDGNEVWLLTAGGALFAAFPAAYACSFSGFYLAIMLVLFCLILRAVSVEFRNMDPAWSKLWDGCLFVGSLLPALLFGVALGNCLVGIPIDANGDYAGTFFGLLRPVPLLCGLMGLSAIVVQGAAWLCAKTPLDSDLRARCVKARTWGVIVELALYIVLTIVALACGLGESNGLAIVAIVIGVLCIVASLVLDVVSVRSEGGDWTAFAANCAMCVGLVLIFAGSMFPNFIVCNTDAALSITIATAASSNLTLTVMTVVTCICVPLVAVYHVLVYRAFRGRVEVEEA